MTRLPTVILLQKAGFSSSWLCFGLVTTFESCLGVQYWIFGLEFYLASIAVQEKLLGQPANNSAIKRRKTFIFWSVTVIYCVLIAIASWGQKEINRDRVNKPTVINTLPSFVMTLFATPNAILLVLAIINLRRLSKKYLGLQETRTVIALYFFFFISEIALNGVWIAFQFASIHSSASELH